MLSITTLPHSCSSCERSSGLYAGSWRAVRRLLDAALEVEARIKTADDQEVLNYMLVKMPEWRARMHLDQNQSCLGTAYESRSQFSLDGGRWRNKATGGVAAVVHYNGGSKMAEFPPSLKAVNATSLAWDSPLLTGGKLTRMEHSWGASKTVSMASVCSTAPATL